MHRSSAKMQGTPLYFNLALVLAAAERVLRHSWSECTTRIDPCLCGLRSQKKEEIHVAYRPVILLHKIYLQS
jgi:hypothetical protein